MMHNPTKLDENFLEKYHPNMTVDNFLNEGLIFKDQNGYTVGLATGVIRENIFHCQKPYADIMVLGTTDGMMLGWVHRDKMSNADDRYLVHADALNKMPRLFKFSQSCPHMSIYGGYFDVEESNWRCLGCDQVIIFSE